MKIPQIKRHLKPWTNVQVIGVTLVVLALLCIIFMGNTIYLAGKMAYEDFMSPKVEQSENKYSLYFYESELLGMTCIGTTAHFVVTLKQRVGQFLVPSDWDCSHLEHVTNEEIVDAYTQFSISKE